MWPVELNLTRRDAKVLKETLGKKKKVLNGFWIMTTFLLFD